ncbi:MAG: 4Fe-4S binding protein [Bacilli bacterium]
MAEFHAYRNIKLCSKDCLCLFVCPTGATNNETGQIDFSKCIGCGACANACPARAITMIPNKYPKQQEKNNYVINALLDIAKSKIEEIKLLNGLMEKVTDEEKKLLKALMHSNVVIIEDLMRESGFMLPQSKNVHDLLVKISHDENINDIVNILLNKIGVNE